ncbi:MAG TPA: Ppx/GppA phosphatase family protein [Nitrospiria bacterium]|jgi:exopolyphosphatase/guanosine-5'-triphosphate,3'-diphosphate pyrophosphatase|nr:Ppx/GppA phosphatase family protein [Nitrospiria bacterium]
MTVMAGIDIGTNTLRLLIAKLNNPNELIELDSGRCITRLGEGMHQDGTLSSFAIARTVSVLKEFKKKISDYKVDDLVVVGTSAAREAKNREEFLGRVKEETGFEVELISGLEEARRTFLGVLLGVGPIQQHRIVVMDIGGGSTEFIIGEHGKPGQIVTTDLGVVTLTERYLTNDPISAHDFSALQAAIESRLKPVCDSLISEKPFSLIGTAGTITTLAAVDQRLDRYHPCQINRYRLKKTSVARMLKEFLSKTAGERSLMPSLEKGREDIIVAGTVILMTTMSRLGCSELLVCDYGLQEGILLDHYLNKHETNKEKEA